MKKYFSVGQRTPCGHHHRTRTGAERCARHLLVALRKNLECDAIERDISWREYVRETVNSDAIVEIYD